jgi:hypothetical protein
MYEYIEGKERFAEVTQPPKYEQSMRLTLGLLLLCHLSRHRKKPTGMVTRWTSRRTNSSRERAKRLPQLFRPCRPPPAARPNSLHSRRSKSRRRGRSGRYLSGSQVGCQQRKSSPRRPDGRGTKLGGRNAQSDRQAAEAAAFADRMRPLMAESPGAVSKPKPPSCSTSAASQRQQWTAVQWSGCERVLPARRAVTGKREAP